MAKHIYYVLDLYTQRVSRAFDDAKEAEEWMVAEGKRTKHTYMLVQNLMAYQGNNDIKISWEGLSDVFDGKTDENPNFQEEGR